MNTARYEFVLRRLATILAVAILTLSLLSAVTGMLLAFYYEPTAGGAYQSLEFITTQVSFGWLIRGIHNLAGNGVIVVALVEIVVMFLGRQFRPSWLTAWISGIFFTLSAIGLGWTAMIIDWTQEGFWRLKVELGTIEAIPLIGSQIREILTGGAVNTTTVAHFYTLHSYVLAIGAIVLAVVHLGAVLLQELEQSQGGIKIRLEGLVAPLKASIANEKKESEAKVPSLVNEKE
ncbi:MAG TPA: cytochrome b N-terminal domain-containing protein [Candidatus Sericytochromatia bacterium]|jgi:cytochrome b6